MHVKLVKVGSRSRIYTLVRETRMLGTTQEILCLFLPEAKKVYVHLRSWDLVEIGEDLADDGRST